ncbi:hypothetical protein E2320_013835 [Naja naja]|nr:hypothetical protein E2320_013835 [Naja naja]
METLGQRESRRQARKSCSLSLWDVSCIHTHKTPSASGYFPVALGVVLTQPVWLVDALTYIRRTLLASTKPDSSLSIKFSALLSL